ncbi:hypothetical protein ACWGKU_29140 [Kitasatospora sp. NPDC054768]|uniref:hypothetical protein n=2 Tax=unclassified Kitasatospora TaxID=2633591 RepID=UPI002F90E410
MNATIVSPFPALSDVADLFDDDPQFARHVRRAEMLSHARGLPRWLKGNAVDLVLVLLAGQDLGLTTWEAINSFYPDDSEESGLALYASAQRALLHRAGWGWRIVEATDERCTVAVTDPNRPSQGELFTTYTMHDALVAELTSGPNANFWRRYPKQMLYARVTSLTVNTHAAHVVRGAPRGWGTLLTADPAPLPMATPGAAAQPTPDSTPTTERTLQDTLPAPELGDEAPIPPGDTTTAPAPVQPMPPANPPQTHLLADTPAPTKALTSPATELADRPTPDLADTNQGDDHTAVPERTDPGPATQPPTTPQPDTDRARSTPEPTPHQPEHPNTVTSDAPDPRQAAWEVLRGMADALKPNGVYQILLGNQTRTTKEKANGTLTDEDEQLILQAQKTLGNSAHAIYRQLLKPDAPSASEPDQSPPTPLQIAPRAQMPDLCACEDAPTGRHRDDCPDSAQ